MSENSVEHIVTVESTQIWRGSVSPERAEFLTDELEQLGEYEGVEVFKLTDETLYFTTEAIREGNDGLMLSYDTLQNLAVEHREDME